MAKISRARHIIETVGILVALIIAIIAVLAVFVASQYGKYLLQFAMRRQPPSVRLSDVYGELKSGDLLLTTGATHILTNSILFQNRFSHAGVVCVIGGVPHVAEAATNRAGQFLRRAVPPHLQSPRCVEGTGCTPLLRYLREYQGTVYLSRLSRPLPPGPEQALLQRAGKRLPYALGLRPMASRVVLGAMDETRHCFEWACDLLDAAGLRPAAGPRLPALWSINKCGAITGLAETGAALNGPGGARYRYAPLRKIENDLYDA